jgi:hypothetical protein
MSLFDLTIRNVKRNFRLYSIYLFSMIIGVIIQYTFSSLMYNKDVIKALQNRASFETGVSIASVAVFLFIVFFILYANSFFMRQRKKEIGMYLLYGLSERQVVRMVFYETLSIGAIALIAGILLGGLLSKLFGMLLMNLMEYEQPISLTFPIQAIAITVALFFLLALIISAQSFRRVGAAFHAAARGRLHLDLQRERFCLLAGICFCKPDCLIGRHSRRHLPVFPSICGLVSSDAKPPPKLSRGQHGAVDIILALSSSRQYAQSDLYHPVQLADHDARLFHGD